MRRTLYTMLLCLILAMPATVNADGFLTLIEDLPLAPGLAEDTDAAMVFESAKGRVASAEARGARSKSDILAFYRATLPQLGWVPQQDGSYIRAEDHLRLDVQDDPSGGSAVRFEISPSTP